MSRLMNVGFGNVVNTAKVVSIIHPESAPAKRLIQRAREEDRVVDATQGRKTKAVILMDSYHVVLSAFQPETLAGRFNSGESQQQEDDGE